MFNSANLQRLPVRHGRQLVDVVAFLEVDVSEDRLALAQWRQRHQQHHKVKEFFPARHFVEQLRLIFSIFEHF